MPRCGIVPDNAVPHELDTEHSAVRASIRGPAGRRRRHNLRQMEVSRAKYGAWASQPRCRDTPVGAQRGRSLASRSARGLAGLYGSDSRARGGAAGAADGFPSARRNSGKRTRVVRGHRPLAVGFSRASARHCLCRSAEDPSVSRERHVHAVLRRETPGKGRRMSRLDTETRDLVIGTLKEYAARELTTSVLIGLDHRDEFPMKVLRDLYDPQQIGLHLLFLPEEYGGMGGGRLRHLPRVGGHGAHRSRASPPASWRPSSAPSDHGGRDTRAEDSG